MIISKEGSYKLTGPSNLDGFDRDIDRARVYCFSKEDGDYPMDTLQNLIRERYDTELPAWLYYLRFVFHIDDSKMTKTVRFVDLWIDRDAKTVIQELAGIHSIEKHTWTYEDLDDLVAKLPEMLKPKRDRDQ